MQLVFCLQSDGRQGDAELEGVNPESDLHGDSISSTLFNQIFHSAAREEEQDGEDGDSATNTDHVCYATIL